MQQKQSWGGSMGFRLVCKYDNQVEDRRTSCCLKGVEDTKKPKRQIYQGWYLGGSYIA